MKDQIYQFLSHLPPFSELPENELSRVAAEMSEEIFPKNIVLSVQGKTKLESVYIIKEGSLELFYETDGKKKLTGFLDRTVDKLPSPKARFKSSPHVSGRSGRQSGNLYQYSQEGMTLLGRIQNMRDNNVRLVTDLKESLVHADRYEAEIVHLIDEYIAQSGLHCPVEYLPQLQDGFEVEEIQELNLQTAGIKTVIWATGYQFDFSLINLPIFDADGYPVHHRGITNYPGLYFVGLPWLYKQKSGLIIGAGEDAEYIASTIASREHPESVKFLVENNVAI
jgi:hypothetical protein